MWAEHQRNNRDRDLNARRVYSSPTGRALESDNDQNPSNSGGSPVGTTPGQPQLNQKYDGISHSSASNGPQKFGMRIAEDPLTPSRILQSRLKKAQQAFASMREPL